MTLLYKGSKDLSKDGNRWIKCELCHKYIINHPKGYDAHIDLHINGIIDIKGEIIKK